MRWVAAASTTFGVLWRKGSWSWTRNLGKTAPERTTHLKLKLFTSGFPVSLELLLPLNIKSRAFEYFLDFQGWFFFFIILLYSAVERKYDFRLLLTAFAWMTASFIHIIIHHRCQDIYILYTCKYYANTCTPAPKTAAPSCLLHHFLGNCSSRGCSLGPTHWFGVLRRFCPAHPTRRGHPVGGPCAALRWASLWDTHVTWHLWNVGITCLQHPTTLRKGSKLGMILNILKIKMLHLFFHRAKAFPIAALRVELKQKWSSSWNCWEWKIVSLGC